MLCSLVGPIALLPGLGPRLKEVVARHNAEEMQRVAALQEAFAFPVGPRERPLPCAHHVPALCVCCIAIALQVARLAVRHPEPLGLPSLVSQRGSAWAHVLLATDVALREAMMFVQGPGRQLVVAVVRKSLAVSRA